MTTQLKTDLGRTLKLYNNPRLQDGEKVYLVEEMIDDVVIESRMRTEKPKTNRGIEKESGWLGSWTEPSGVTTDTFARGAFIVHVEEKLDRWIEWYEENELRYWIVTLIPV